MSNKVSSKDSDPTVTCSIVSKDDELSSIGESDKSKGLKLGFLGVLYGLPFGDLFFFFLTSFARVAKVNFITF